MPPGTLPRYFRSGPEARNGLSLSRNDCSFQSHHCGVNVPGLLLRFLTTRPRCPFGLLTPPHLRFAPEDGGFTASVPLQRLRAVRLVASAISTPLQDFYIPKDQSVQSLQPPVGPPSEFARFPFAPRSLSISRMPATDHRSRFATFPEACCSSTDAKSGSLLKPFCKNNDSS
jgi:hypothetical protein